MENFDLEILKKKYGEKFAKLCRMLFPDFLDKKGFLSEVITSNFAESKLLYDDIKNNRLTLDFKNFIFSFMPEKKYNKKTKSNENPYELMQKAGYTLYKCETNEEIVKFKKFWDAKEELCTFRDNLRVNDNMVFFAVKQGAENISRNDYESPQRQDEYGTSVISIQISKSKPNTISILNRYNHSVKNPDSTFSNNLENIVEGLTNSFVKEFDLDLDSKQTTIDWPNYFKAADGKFYRYTYERLNHRFCPDNMYIDPYGEVVRFNKDRYVLFDYFILDTKENVITKVLPYAPENFTTTISDIAKTQITKSGDEKQIVITNSNGQETIIGLDKYSRIIKYHNESITRVPDFFLNNSSAITELSLPNVERIETNFLTTCKRLKTLSLPNLVFMGDNALMFNESVENVYLPKLEKIGKYFLRNNEKVRELNLPKLKFADSQFLYSNKKLHAIYAPNLETARPGFLYNNVGLTEISFPSLKTAESHFISYNKNIASAYLPNLQNVGELFLSGNNALTTLSLPKVEMVGANFLQKNTVLKELHAVKLKTTEQGFLENNEHINKREFQKNKASYKSMS